MFGLLRANGAGKSSLMRTIAASQHLGRAFASTEEPPLYLERGQKYLMDGKSSLVLLAIRDLVGEEKLNATLRDQLSKSLQVKDYEVNILGFLKELYRMVSTQDRQLIEEWMKQVIRYELAVDHTQYQQLPNGRYEITVRISAKRFKTLPSGREVAMDIDEPLKIGGFHTHPKHIGKTDEIPYWGTHRIQDSLTTIRLTLDSLPRYIGVDPFLTRPDKNYANNLTPIY